MGVFPTRRTKKSCSMTEEETVRREGKRSSSFPNLLGWLGYWLLTYSSKAHWDFSCRPSTWATSDRPQASTEKNESNTHTHKKERRRSGQDQWFNQALKGMPAKWGLQQHREDRANLWLMWCFIKIGELWSSPGIKPPETRNNYIFRTKNITVLLFKVIVFHLKLFTTSLIEADGGLLK